MVETNTEVLNHTLMVYKLPDTPPRPGFYFYMRYIDNFKFFSPFFKEKAARIVGVWESEMDEYISQTMLQSPTADINEIKFSWLFIKMAELEAVNINEHIAEDWKKANL